MSEIDGMPERLRPLLHLNVGELQAVVAEVGKLIGSVPGASLLRRRAEREP